MSTKLDSTVVRILDKERKSDETHTVDDEDELLAELEEDTAALDAFREKRMQQLHEEVQKARYMRNQNHGTYQTIHDEKEVMDIATKTKQAVIHFSHSDFRRCEIMDKHLRTLAPKHYEARFIKVDVENAPFLVAKLGVRVLPCVMGFVDGKGVGRIEGFDALGNTDSFRTEALERLLLGFQVLERMKLGEADKVPEPQKKPDGDSDDDDWD
ncbi:thioredoxin-like protein [Geopyxis carbonaria]|nr:thioredoxin-like protein [Geopyxis carbonaria]